MKILVSILACRTKGNETYLSTSLNIYFARIIQKHIFLKHQLISLNSFQHVYEHISLYETKYNFDITKERTYSHYPITRFVLPFNNFIFILINSRRNSRISFLRETVTWFYRRSFCLLSP